MIPPARRSPFPEQNFSAFQNRRVDDSPEALLIAIRQVVSDFGEDFSI